MGIRPEKITHKERQNGAHEKVIRIIITIEMLTKRTVRCCSYTTK